MALDTNSKRHAEYILLASCSAVIIELTSGLQCPTSGTARESSGPLLVTISFTARRRPNFSAPQLTSLDTVSNKDRDVG